jgi:hypothetical protein
MTTENTKYPGSLGKRPTQKELDADRDAALLNVPPDDLNANRIAGGKYERERTANLVVALMEHFEIPLGTENKWFYLALRLARRHVPAFQDPIRAGRKPKMPFGSLAYIFANHSKTQTKKKPGAPKKWPDEMYRQILQDVKSTCEREGLKPGRGSKKAALQILLKNIPMRRRKYKLDWWQKQHSKAVRMFPESAR